MAGTPHCIHSGSRGRCANGRAPGKKRAACAALFHGWWRWRESNPRPKALHLRHYMLSPPFVLVLRQHDVRSTPQDTPALLEPWLAGRRHGRSCDDDPTSTSTGTSGFGAYALSGESVDVVVGV